MPDTRVGQQQGNPADVAQDGFAAMMRGDTRIVSGAKNKLQVAMTGIVSADVLAEPGLGE